MQRLRAAIAQGRSRFSQLRPSTYRATRVRATALGLLALAGAAMLTTAVDLDSPIRLGLTLAAVLTAPGWAATAFLLPLPASMEWTLAVAASLVGSLLISVVMLMTGWWFPGPVLIGYLGLTCFALLLRLLRPVPPAHAPVGLKPTEQMMVMLS